MERSVSLKSARFSFAKRIAWIPDEVAYGGHLTALVAPAKIIFITMILGIPIGILPLAIAYLATLIIYSIDYYRSADKDMATNPGRATYYSGMAGTFRYRMLVYGIFLATALAVYANVLLILAIAAIAILGVTYASIFKNLTRQVPGFKNLFTSAVWASGIILGVMACHPFPWGSAVMLLFLFIFMRDLGNVIFFDLKDARTDRAEGLKTLPVLLGRERTIALLCIINVVSFIPLVYGALSGMLPAFILSLTAIAPYTFYCLWRARSMPHDRVNYSMADAEFLLWPLLVAIGACIGAA